MKDLSCKWISFRKIHGPVSAHCSTMGRSDKIAKPNAPARQAVTKQRATNVVDKAEQHESCELKRRSTEEETEMAVRDNFRNFTEIHRTMVLEKEGKSIFDRVLHAKRKKCRDPITIGKKFFSDLKDENPLESDLADERLFRCMRSVFEHDRNSVSVPTYMQEVGKPNTLNLQALQRATPKVPPGGKNHDASNFVLAVMEFIAVGEYEVSRLATVTGARDRFDQVLVKDLAFFRSNDRTGKECCQLTPPTR